MVVEFDDGAIEINATDFKAVGAHEDLYFFDADGNVVGWVNRDAAAAVVYEKEE